MDWFYNDSISLLKYGGEMYRGTFIPGQPITKNIACDVQPSCREQVYADYGYFVDAEYAAYCDVDSDITAGSEVLYKGTTYKIVKLIDWNDYFILYLKAAVL